MPIYAYRCATCGNAQDVLRKISDPPLSVCPACGAATFVKQVTAAGFQLKGSGWYVTDFRGDNKKPAKSGDGEPAATSDANSGESADAAKPDANKSDDKKPADKEPDAVATAPAAPPAAAAPAAAAPTTPSKGGT